MRALLLLLAFLLHQGAFAADSEQTKKVVPPVSGKAEPRNQQNNPTNTKHEVAVTLPASASLVLSGSLNVKSESVESRTHEEPSKWADPVTWFTGVLMLANILLWLTTRGLVTEAKNAGDTAKIAADAAKESADATKASVSAMQDTAERQLRAYIGIQSIELVDLEVGKSPKTKLVFKNYGATPAYGLVSVGGIAVGPSLDSLPPPKYGSVVPSNSSISPGQTQFGGFDAEHILEQGHIDLINSGESKLWVHGKAEWLDAFDKSRYKTYRFILKAGNLVICESGNDEN